MKHINVVIFCAFYMVTVVQILGNIFFEDLPSEERSNSIIGQITSTLVDTLSSFCLRSFDSIGCDNIGEPSEIGRTKAFLYTKQNPQRPEFLHNCGGRLSANTNFNPKDKTEIFIHGWLDGICRTKWLTEMKDELLKRGSYNVILIDWTWGNGLGYYKGGNNTYVVRRHVASLIQNIMMDSGVGPENFHLVGHSFGAQIAGLVGKIVPNLRRITALDPALEPFQNKPPTQRLDASDAKLVDVIHSNGGNETFKTLGDIQPLGDADFYPNGGRIQESCYPYIIVSLTKLDVLYGLFSLLPIFCNHLQSIQYYKASINPTECEFVGFQCSDYESFKSGKCASCGKGGSRCATMGMDYEYRKHPSPKKGRYRKYYLDTALFHPYCSRDPVYLIN